MNQYAPPSRERRSSAVDADGAAFPSDHARKRVRSAPGFTTRHGHFTRELGLMRDARRFVGSGSGIHFIRNVYLTLANRSLGVHGHQALSPNNDLVPGEDDQLEDAATSRSNNHSRGNEQKLWLADEVVDATASTQPPFDQLVGWTKDYFEIWHAALPFLHAPAVLDTLEQISLLGMDKINPTDAIIVRSIVSMSLADSRQGPRPLQSRIPEPLLFLSVEDAMSSIQVSLTQPTSLRLLQAAVSVQLFLISMLRFNSASRLGGLIVRMAFHLGLHRCPARFSVFSAEEARIRRRLFWSIYCLERLLCQSLGLPLDIRDDDVDVCYPGEEKHVPFASTSPRTEQDHRLRLLTYIAKHAKIRGLILELRNKSVHFRQDTSERAAFVQAELAKWSNEIYEAAENDGEDGDSHESRVAPLSPVHRLLLQVLKQESVICLNRPLMTANEDSPYYTAALHNCVDAARSIVMTMKKHQSQHAAEGPSARLLVPIVWPSFTWALWMSCFVLIYASFEGQLPLRASLKYINHSREILQHLSGRGTSWPDFCIQAIEELKRSAIKEQEIVDQTSTNPNGAVEDSEPNQASQWLNPNKRARVNQESLPLPNDQGRSSPSSSRLATGSVHNHSATPASQLRRANLSASQSQPLTTPTSASAMPASCRPVTENFNTFQFEGRETTAQLPDGCSDSRDGTGSMLWYDQMFGDSFTAIDYPFLAATQLDPIMDPLPFNWNQDRSPLDLNTTRVAQTSFGFHGGRVRMLPRN